MSTHLKLPCWVTCTLNFRDFNDTEMLFMDHRWEEIQEYPRSVPDNSSHFLQCQEKNTHRTIISQRQESPILFFVSLSTKL